MSLLSEKKEKLNIKFRLVKENELEETESERPTIRLVLEGTDPPETESRTPDAAFQSGCTAPPADGNQESCSSDEKGSKSAP